MVSFRESYVDVEFFAYAVTNDLIFETFDEGMRTQFQVMFVGFAAFERNAVNAAFVADFRNIAHLSGSVCYFYQSSVLFLNFFQFFCDFFVCYFCGNFFHGQTFVLTQSYFGFYSYINDEFNAFCFVDVFNIQSGSGNNVQTQFFDCCHVFIGEDVVDCIFVEEVFAVLRFDELSGHFAFSETRQRDLVFVFVVSESQTCFQCFRAYFERKFYFCFFFADQCCIIHG